MSESIDTSIVRALPTADSMHIRLCDALDRAVHTVHFALAKLTTAEAALTAEQQAHERLRDALGLIANGPNVPATQMRAWAKAALDG